MRFDILFWRIVLTGFGVLGFVLCLYISIFAIKAGSILSILVGAAVFSTGCDILFEFSKRLFNYKE